MNENLGSTDKIIRIFLGLTIVLLGIKYETWWGLAGLIFPITAVINWCPIYAALGISSNRDGKKELPKI